MFRSWMRIAARLPSTSIGWLPGLCVGFWLATMVMGWTLSAGTTLPVVTSAVLVSIACLAGGCSQAPRLQSLGHWKNATLAIGFAAWIVSSRDLTEWATWCFAWWPVHVLSIDLVSVVATVPVALVVIGPPMLGLGAWLHTDDAIRPELRRRKLFGLGMGLILAPHTVLLWIGSSATATCLVFLCLLHVAHELTLHTEPGRRLRAAIATWAARWMPVASDKSQPALSREFRVSTGAQAATGDEDEQAHSRLASGRQLRWLNLATICLAGCGLAVMQRVWSQLFVSQIHWSLTLLGCVCIGLSLGSIMHARRLAKHSGGIRSYDPILTASCIAFVLFGYSWWVSGMLRLNTYCETPWITLAVRTAMVAAMALPLTLLFGVTCASHSSGETRRQASGIDWLAAATGYLAVRWFSPSPGATGIVVVFGLLSCGLFVALLLERHSWKAIAKWGMAPAAISGVTIVLSSYSAAHSARLLFSTQVFLAARLGEPAALLPQLDATRLMSTREGRECSWTVWSQQGYRISVRRDGMPHGSFSRDLTICPHSASEIAPTILPLVLHHEPRSVMLLGTVTPASLSACTAFPIERIHCVLRDADSLALERELAELATQKNPFEDDRVTCLAIDPVLAMRAAHEQLHDVIICRQEQSASPGDSGTFTVEFYRHVASHLDPTGIFAQQVDLADYGAKPLQRMLSGLRTAFPSVVFVHTSPDKGLLLASPAERVWLDEDLARRAEAPHVRRLCSQLGWDWSVLLSLTSTPPAGVEQLAAGVSPLSSSEGRFLCEFPVEVLRWGPKSHELYMTLAPHSSALIAWLGTESPVAADVTHRLTDMTLQRQIIQDHPDFYWAYRSELKDRLQQPRNAVVQASGGGLESGMHPDDQRRVDYLRALGTAATQQHPDQLDVIELCEFLEPYDPLVSFFVHQEIAHLYARGETPMLQQELQHLLHSVFYGPGHDRSVRNIVESLQLVLEHPELIENSQERFDCLNGLMELLKYRWQLRMQSVNATSRFGPVDATLSLQTAEQALQAMDVLQPRTNLSSADWHARRRVLERHFINEVETYRDRISRHVGRFASTPPTEPVDEFETSDEMAGGLDIEPVETASGPPSGAHEESVQ